MNKLVDACHEAVLYLFAWLLTRFVKKEHDLWLISERHDEARDNGYHFYKYLVENKKDVNICYVIDKGVADEKKIKELSGKRVAFGSFKHYCLYHMSRVCLSTHIYGYVPSRAVCERLDRVFARKKVRVFLQHGVIMNFHPADMYEMNNISLYICSAEREKEFLMKANHYPDDVMCLSGMSRYDDLVENERKKQILIMPTWRAYLSNMSVKDFQNSSYFKCFWSLINDQELIQNLSKSGYELVFYPHYEMQKYIHLFEANDEHIVIADHESYDVHELLRDTRFLVTDYSSVHFDFAYMKKPIAYFQFDKDSFYGEHYIKGYYDFSFDGFGPVFEKSNEIRDYILECMKNGFQMESLYCNRVDSFFRFRDQSNSERIYKRIIELL